MAGFAVGLLGFYFVALTEFIDPSANAFLFASLSGSATGMLAGWVLTGRPPATVMFFVGDQGCSDVKVRGETKTERTLLFENVQDLSARTSSMTVQGVKTVARELHVTGEDGKTRLWLATPASDTQGKDAHKDALVAYLSEILSAFEQYTRLCERDSPGDPDTESMARLGRA